MLRFSKYLFLMIVVLSAGQCFSQFSTVDSLPSENLNWYNKSPKNDKIQGVDVDRSYQELLANKKPKKSIIVAVIDCGVDYNHEDLKDRMWVNKKEIPDNKIDDDNNGYIDDIYGWNFLGNSEGENINDENVEVTRLYRLFQSKYKNKAASEIPDNEKAIYELCLKAVGEYDDEKTYYQEKVDHYNEIKDKLESAEKAIKTALLKDELSLEDLEEFTSEDTTLINHRDNLLVLYANNISIERLTNILEYYGNTLKSYYNLDFTPRQDIIGDDPYDVQNNNYGNGDVKGPDSSHGTMVAGIIGGIRGNGVGVDGVADSVLFMALRSVPNGDEYDKDIVLSIRYAVDNGAQIINMSFGKYYSPLKKDIDEAIKYAESKGVLMIKASGNDETNIDEKIQYPNPRLEDGTEVYTWLTVGANDKLLDKTLPGTFSNYGKKYVDIFAPGVGIISSTPESEYDIANGTSFACPVVSGVAALVWSYYPELTAHELRDILMKSGTNYKKKKVYQPGYYDDVFIKVRFGDLSQSGSVVNAYYALKMAEKVVAGK